MCEKSDKCGAEELTDKLNEVFLHVAVDMEIQDEVDRRAKWKVRKKVILFALFPITFVVGFIISRYL